MQTVYEVKMSTSEEEKLVYLTSSNKTGGCTVDKMPLMTIEKQVQLTICKDQATGIAGFDTLV